MPEKFTLDVDFTEALLNRVAKLCLERGGKKLLQAITERAIQQKKIEIQNDPVYTLKEIAQMTKRSVKTIENHIHYGYLKATKHGDYRVTHTNYLNYINGIYDGDNNN
ncbi:hypothetical protein [Tenacibaculum sp. 190524A02b]|uniref:hypothetical protein n=1 Tax=Tenacibaculum vairaonense TaxID=3137860 RepID=UPI0031FA84DF